VHPLLCAGRNPASAPVLAFARSYQWMALQALAHCTARLLLAAQQPDAERALDADWKVFASLAELGMEDRARDLQENWCVRASCGADRGSCAGRLMRPSWQVCRRSV
jgi:hypothetical protein